MVVVDDDAEPANNDDNKENREKYERWVKGGTIIIVVTAAFSVGISYDLAMSIQRFILFKSLVEQAEMDSLSDLSRHLVSACGYRALSFLKTVRTVAGRKKAGKL